MERKNIDRLFKRLESFATTYPAPREWAGYLESLKSQGEFDDLDERSYKAIKAFYVCSAALGHRHETTIGGIKPFVRLEPAPPAVANELRSSGVLEKIDKSSQEAISAFYFYVASQLLWVQHFDDVCVFSSSKWFPHSPPTPAMREKLKSISNKISDVLKMADAGGVGGKNLLLDAQARVNQFREQSPSRLRKNRAEPAISWSV